MNLIDRDKLIERLEISECETCRFGGEYCVDCKSIDSHRILSAIESLPTVNNWIPVERELPKEYGEYGIRTKHRYGVAKYLMCPKKWVDDDGDVYGVIAWMSIPTYEVNND